MTLNRSYAPSAVEHLVGVIRAVQLDECETIHGGYPTGYTCFDVQRIARERPDGYVPAYREAILRGDHLCDRCQVRVAIAALDTDLKGKKDA